MKSTVRCSVGRLIASLVFATALCAGAADPPKDTTPTTLLPAFARTLRISALIKSPTGIKVGLSDTQVGWNKFVAVGERFNDIEVVSASYETETVVLRKDDLVVRLALDRDPNAPEPSGVLLTGSETNIWKGDGIENYLRENPDAVVKTPPIVRPANPTPVTGLGPGIEKAMREQGLQINTNPLPAGSMGEGIESVLRKNPELAEKLRRPVEGRGEGIESVLRDHPELATNAPPAPQIKPPETTKPDKSAEPLAEPSSESPSKSPSESPSS